jgi:hypothetical protein
MQVRPVLNDGGDMFLHIATKAPPIRTAAAECRASNESSRAPKLGARIPRDSRCLSLCDCRKPTIAAVPDGGWPAFCPFLPTNRVGASNSANHGLRRASTRGCCGVVETLTHPCTVRFGGEAVPPLGRG